MRALLMATVILAAVPSTSRAGEAVVRFAPSLDPGARTALVRTAGGTVTRDLHLVDGLGVRLDGRAAARLRGAAGVRSITPVAAVESRATAYSRPTNAYASAIGAVKAWDYGRGFTGRGIGVAVIDTGIDASLPDFDDLRSGAGSRVIATAVVNPAAADARDGYGHGTHVAGIIAGNGINRDGWRNARSAYIGVAPEARLVSVKIDDGRGRASTLDAIYGIQFAVDHARRLGIRVINLSLASSAALAPQDDPLDAAVEAAWVKGLVVVAAAGNDGDAKQAVAHAPGNDPYVITVGATDDQGTPSYDDDQLASWSSRGVTQTGVAKPEVLAPGAHIVSTLATGSAFADRCRECVVETSYFQAGGTSMATAVVSGAAALILQAHPEWTPDQVKAALVATAHDVPGAGAEVAVGAAIASPPAAARQAFAYHPLVDPVTGDLDYSAASWRAASWRALDGAAASWRCDCSRRADGTVDPAAASWRAASWRTSFAK